MTEAQITQRLQEIFDASHGEWLWGRISIENPIFKRKLCIGDGIIKGYALIYEGAGWAERETAGGFVVPFDSTQKQNGIYIWQCCVDKKEHQKGLMSALFERLFDEYAGREAYSIVAKENKASNKLHTKFGFKSILDFPVDGHPYSLLYRAPFRQS